jgi:hypothetical protein
MSELLEVEQEHYRVDWFPIYEEDAEVMTDWFPPFIEPVHEGVYNASSYGVRDMFRYWNGYQWSLPWTPATPIGVREALKQLQTKKTDIYWRGLTEKAKGMLS